MSRALVFAAALSSMSGVLAQQSPMSGPVQGYAFDAPTRSIRAVAGSLGSASLGPAVLLELDFASVAPRQNYAIAVRGGQTVFVSGLGASTPATSMLPDSPSTPEGVAWSDDGSTAVVYSRTGSWIETVSGLPGSANAGTPLSISPLGGSLSAVAASAQGLRVVVGITGDHAGVYEIAGGQSFSPLLDVASPIALAFSQDGGTLYAIDGATNQVSQINLANTATETWRFDAADAVAIRPARDATNRMVVYVAGRSSHLLVAYDGSTHQSIARVALSFEPTIIEPLGGNGFVLRRRASDSDPVWSFTNAAQPMVFFVPATPIPDVRGDRHR